MEAGEWDLFIDVESVVRMILKLPTEGYRRLLNNQNGRTL